MTTDDNKYPTFNKDDKEFLMLAEHCFNMFMSFYTEVINRKDLPAMTVIESMLEHLPDTVNKVQEGLDEEASNVNIPNVFTDAFEEE